MLSFEKFGKLVSRITIPLAIVFCIIMIPAFYLSNQNSYYYGSSHIFAAGTQYGDDTAFIEDTFGIKDTYDLMDTITADMFKVNLVAIGAVFLVLVLTMIIVGFLLGIISTHGLLSQLGVSPWKRNHLFFNLCIVCSAGNALFDGSEKDFCKR